ncbi:MAG: hypothetical protein UX57_C0006G0037 [Candidatus Uhrbacteria bacterium GW2011_GWE2_46_68]|uniref:Uncharacterized protein n=2 Tax=Candidatus Uhriibacteriota TaxID=1752732 RepID=A0A0G1Q8K1_9BACT|nr:MAG: hypothetical protein UX45_C0008G0023 [Candidatus Uhrbacteria bacterium GW2011_GWF2_46_218]KKU41127.1 MAG: hypothetical protein UX57_C0006G0037 [Candidatus Uhrbacteria bacterium GW2011_GWE2_46_68]
MNGAINSMFSLKHLLPSALDRAHVTRQVTTSLIVMKSDEFLFSVLPSAAKTEARTLALTGTVLVIGCRSSALGEFVRQQEETLLSFLKRELPQTHISRVRIQILHNLPPTNGFQDGTIDTL